jgi:hypothetical protein
MSVLGSQLKINVNVEPIGDTHLDNCNFKCTFFINPKKNIELQKSQLIRVDADNYIALIDSSQLGVGTIRMTIEVDIPDSDFPNGVRKEIDTICTGITIQGKDVY